MGILLGLVAAFSWGAADFFARFVTHRIGALRTLFYMQAGGFLFLSLALPLLGGWGHLHDGSGWTPWAWGSLAGLLNTAAMFALYRSFELGKLSVVAPVSSSYPALTVLLSLLTGEHLSALRAAGIALTVAGVILASMSSASPRNSSSNTAPQPTQQNPRAAILWAVCAALGFGVLFWLLGVRVVPRVGGPASVWMIRLSSMLLSSVLVFAWPRRAPSPAPFSRRNLVLLVSGMALLDTSAFVCTNVGILFDQVSVVSVLASLYGAVTVALAAAILREKLAWWQWSGIALIFAGVFFVSR